MKTLLLSTAAVLALSGAAYAQTATAPAANTARMASDLSAPAATMSADVTADAATSSATDAAASTMTAAPNAAVSASATAAAPSTSSMTATSPSAATPPTSTTTTTAAPSTSTGMTASTGMAPMASASFSDDEIAKVATAAAETRRLNADGQAKIAAATTPEAKAAATKDLQTSLQAAVTASGLTVSRYNEIAKAAATDTALAARLTTTAGANSATQGDAAPASATAPQ